MIIKLNMSSKIKNLEKRLKKLPVLLKETAETIIKNDAEGFINEFKQGIKKDDFGLKRLRPQSIQQKKIKGYSKSNVPLYGAGEKEKNSLINVMRLKKLKNGYRVYLSKSKHHEAKIPLNILFEIHEEGRLIIVTERMRAFLHYIGIHLKKSTDIIRIPPRPTRKKAFQRWLVKRLKKENINITNKAMTKYLLTGDWKILIKDYK